MYHNYTACHFAKGEAQGSKHVIHDRKRGQGSSRTGLPCRIDVTISHWLKLIVQHPQQCGEHPHQEMASYGPVQMMKNGLIYNWYANDERLQVFIMSNLLICQDMVQIWCRTPASLPNKNPMTAIGKGMQAVNFTTTKFSSSQLGVSANTHWPYNDCCNLFICCKWEWVF